jgi:predicted transcriptional regulator
MEKNGISERFGQLVGALGLNANKLSKMLGGSTAKYYKLLDGDVSPSFDTTDRLLEVFPQVSAEWFMRGKGEMFTDNFSIQSNVVNKDAIISQQEKRIGELEANEIFYKNIIETITGKKFKVVSNSAKLGLRINTNLVNIKNDWDLIAIGSFDINKIGRG